MAVGLTEDFPCCAVITTPMLIIAITAITVPVTTDLRCDGFKQVSIFGSVSRPPMSAGVHFRYKSLAAIKPLQTVLNKPVGLLSILTGCNP